MHSPSINAQLAVNGFNDRTVMHHGTMTTRIQILVKGYGGNGIPYQSFKALQATSIPLRKESLSRAEPSYSCRQSMPHRLHVEKKMHLGHPKAESCDHNRMSCGKGNLTTSKWLICQIGKGSISIHCKA
jgi:hypothetical protein